MGDKAYAIFSLRKGNFQCNHATNKSNSLGGAFVIIEFSIESQPFGWGIEDVVEKCKGKTFRVAIDGEIAPSRSQSTIGGTKSYGGK